MTHHHSLTEALALAESLNEDISNYPGDSRVEDSASVTAEGRGGSGVSYLDYSVEYLAEHNGARLLAAQLHGLQNQCNEAAARHYAEMKRLKATLDEAQRIGIEVMRLEDAGRKTVKIADLTEQKS